LMLGLFNQYKVLGSSIFEVPIEISDSKIGDFLPVSGCEGFIFRV
jgi:hypothetical protein